MLETKQISEVLKKIKADTKSSTILNYCKCANHKLSFTDLKQHFQAGIDSAIDGLLDKACLVKTNNIEHCKTNKEANSDDYPNIPILDKPEKQPDPASLLFDILNNNIYKFASQDITRPNICGVVLNSKDNYICSTDGYKLAKLDVDYLWNKESIIIPAEVFYTLAEIDEYDVITDIYFNKDYMQFDFMNCSLIVKLTEGDYPQVLVAISEKGENVTLTKKIRKL